jgi:phosphoribosylformylglycinamidine (FGAM) synthase PurS component
MAKNGVIKIRYIQINSLFLVKIYPIQIDEHVRTVTSNSIAEACQEYLFGIFAFSSNQLDLE